MQDVPITRTLVAATVGAPGMTPAVSPARTPDFYTYAPAPISAAEPEGEFVLIRWPDGRTLWAHALWLYENRMGDVTIEERSREAKIDPAVLPDGSSLGAFSVAANGDLTVNWSGEAPSCHHSGWLRHVAEGRHRPAASIPEPRRWTASEYHEPITFDGLAVLDHDDALRDWLDTLCRYGLARLQGLPRNNNTLLDLGRRVGALRNTNFGTTWPVSVDTRPTSTANTALPLPPHTDLPTRETPPGFQLLHCLVNTCAAGFSTMADGYAVVGHLREHEPDAYDALSTLNWIFFNRSPDHDHRWSGPIIDHGGPGTPLTLRAFHPVRAFPDMADADVPRAYNGLRVFSRLAADDRFQMRYPFRPGDLVAFDNRRILHGRAEIDTNGGVRELHGTYIDHDEVYSRLRVLARRQELRGMHRSERGEGRKAEP